MGKGSNQFRHGNGNNINNNNNNNNNNRQRRSAAPHLSTKSGTTYKGGSIRKKHQLIERAKIKKSYYEKTLGKNDQEFLKVPEYYKDIFGMEGTDNNNKTNNIKSEEPKDHFSRKPEPKATENSDESDNEEIEHRESRYSSLRTKRKRDDDSDSDETESEEEEEESTTNVSSLMELDEDMTEDDDEEEEEEEESEDEEEVIEKVQQNASSKPSNTDKSKPVKNANGWKAPEKGKKGKKQDLQRKHKPNPFAKVIQERKEIEEKQRLEREQLKKEKDEAMAQRKAYYDKRKRATKKLTKRNGRGQPFLGDHISFLLGKINQNSK